jgi:hypothetical protein
MYVRYVLLVCFLTRFSVYAFLSSSRPFLPYLFSLLHFPLLSSDLLLFNSLPFTFLSFTLPFLPLASPLLSFLSS